MKIYLFAVMLFIGRLSFSQSISGTLVTEQGEPIPFAAIVLNSTKDSSLVKAVISEEEGNFEITDLASGKYILKISSLGFSTFQKEISLKDESVKLGRLVLATAFEQLDEVQVVSQKPLVQVLADKTVFNVENTINATGTSAFELLRKAPGVVIDNNGGIIVEGKSGVQFYIDGRVSLLQGTDLINYLESLQATDIEAVEIITQPSSKYDAAGNAGIINIKLKKDKSLGTNGSLTAGVTIGDFARTNSSLNFNNRTKEGNLYGSYSNRFGKSTGFFNLFRTQQGTQLLAQTLSTYDNNSNNIKLGYDHYVSQQSTVGVILNANSNNNFSENNARTPIRRVGSIVNDSVLRSDNRISSGTSNINGNLNYKYSDTIGHTLNVDLDYGKYETDRESLQPNIYYSGDENQVLRANSTRQITPINISIVSFKMDYEQDLLKGKLGLGFKFSKVSTVNTFDFFNIINDVIVLNSNRSNRFTYEEAINAGYMNYNYKWEKWNLQAGLRVENTVSDGNLVSRVQSQDAQVKRNYVNWFPSGGITYQVNPKNQFALIYSKRIQRPNYASLNPFEYVIDDLYSSKGNPFLQPQYTDNIKFSHTYNYSLTTSLSYSYVSEYFAQVTLPEGNNRSFITTRNVANQEIINLGISYPKQIKNWWNFYVSMNAYTSSYSATNLGFISIKQETLSAYVQNTFTLLDDLKMEISGWYSSPSVWGGTYLTKSLGSLNLAFQKKFLKEKLTTRISFNDILYTSPWKGNTQFENLFIEGSGGNDSRNFAFSITYDFGSNEIKKERNRKTGLNDENERIGN